MFFRPDTARDHMTTSLFSSAQLVLPAQVVDGGHDQVGSYVFFLRGNHFNRRRTKQKSARWWLGGGDVNQPR